MLGSATHFQPSARIATARQANERDALAASANAEPVERAVADFDTIYREERGRVLAAVRTVIGASDELEDVVQIAFLEIHRCLPRFQGRSKLSTWVYRIALNVALQHVRKRRRKRWLTLGFTGDEVGWEPWPVDAVRQMEDRQILQRVYAAVGMLSEKKRVVWLLHEVQGLDPHEIAEILGIPMNTVRSRLLSARRDLMDALERRSPGRQEG